MLETPGNQDGSLSGTSLPSRRRERPRTGAGEQWSVRAAAGHPRGGWLWAEALSFLNTPQDTKPSGWGRSESSAPGLSLDMHPGIQRLDAWSWVQSPPRWTYQHTPEGLRALRTQPPGWPRTFSGCLDLGLWAQCEHLASLWGWKMSPRALPKVLPAQVPSCSRAEQGSPQEEGCSWPVRG